VSFFEVAIIETTIRIFTFVWEILPRQPTIQAQEWTIVHKHAYRNIYITQKTRRESIGFGKPYRLTSRKLRWEISLFRNFGDNGHPKRPFIYKQTNSKYRSGSGLTDYRRMHQAWMARVSRTKFSAFCTKFSNNYSRKYLGTTGEARYKGELKSRITVTLQIFKFSTWFFAQIVESRETQLSSPFLGPGDNFSKSYDENQIWCAPRSCIRSHARNLARTHSDQIWFSS
jgi:hypothetical protein